jgi:ABC-type sugar transport system permease subunit
MEITSKQRKGVLRRHWQNYLWVTPAILIVFILTTLPSLFTISISFRDWSLLSAKKPFVGFDNYVRMFQDEGVLNGLRLSFQFLIIVVPLIILFGMLMALLLNQKTRFRGIYRALFLMPWVLSMVVVGLNMRWIFDEQTGLINYALDLIGLKPLPWFSSGILAFMVIGIAQVWRLAPFAMVIILAGLQSIPEEINDAARVDGASNWQRFWTITIPLLQPVLLVLIVILSLATFNMVDLIMVMTTGGPGTSTKLISYYMYEQSFAFLRFGYGATMAMVLFVVNVILTVVYIRLIRSSVQ